MRSKSRVALVGAIPLLLAAWSLLPILLTPFGFGRPSLILATGAATLSAAGVIVVILRQRGSEVEARVEISGRNQGASEQPTLVGFLRGWGIFLALAIPAILYVSAVSTGAEWVLIVGVSAELVVIAVVQGTLVTRI